jgi:hypothetical protein
MVEVVPTSQQAFKLQILDNANSRSFLDPSLYQNIMCSQNQETRAYVQYDWVVSYAINKSVIYDSRLSSA